MNTYTKDAGTCVLHAFRLESVIPTVRESDAVRGFELKNNHIIIDFKVKDRDKAQKTDEYDYKLL